MTYTELAIMLAMWSAYLIGGMVGDLIRRRERTPRGR